MNGSNYFWIVLVPPIFVLSRFFVQFFIIYMYACNECTCSIWRADSQINGIKHKHRYDNNSIKSTFDSFFSLSILCVSVYFFERVCKLKDEERDMENFRVWHSLNAVKRTPVHVMRTYKLWKICAFDARYANVIMNSSSKWHDSEILELLKLFMVLFVCIHISCFTHYTLCNHKNFNKSFASISACFIHLHRHGLAIVCSVPCWTSEQPTVCLFYASSFSSSIFFSIIFFTSGVSLNEWMVNR